MNFTNSTITNARQMLDMFMIDDVNNIICDYLSGTTEQAKEKHKRHINNFIPCMRTALNDMRLRKKHKPTYDRIYIILRDMDDRTILTDEYKYYTNDGEINEYEQANDLTAVFQERYNIYDDWRWLIFGLFLNYLLNGEVDNNDYYENLDEDEWNEWNDYTEAPPIYKITKSITKINMEEVEDDNIINIDDDYNMTESDDSDDSEDEETAEFYKYVMKKQKAEEEEKERLKKMRDQQHDEYMRQWVITQTKKENDEKIYNLELLNNPNLYNDIHKEFKKYFISDVANVIIGYVAGDALNIGCDELKRFKKKIGTYIRNDLLYNMDALKPKIRFRYNMIEINKGTINIFMKIFINGIQKKNIFLGRIYKYTHLYNGIITPKIFNIDKREYIKRYTGDRTEIIDGMARMNLRGYLLQYNTYNPYAEDPDPNYDTDSDSD